MKVSLYNENSEYVQSANTLFHFMDQATFLTAAIDRKGLVPRYCEENISYLDVKNSNGKVNKICVLQKCFCDIPLHKITEKFQCKLIRKRRNPRLQYPYSFLRRICDCLF